MVKTNDDQSKEYQTIYFKFNYDEKPCNNGGTYIEVRNVQVEGYETLMDENINISYQSYIEGTWSVTEDGELAMKPDLNTLKVSVNPNVKDIEKDIFSNLHTEYSMLYDKDQPFTDLKVEGDNMSFVSYTDENTLLQKTDTDIMRVLNKKPTPAETTKEISTTLGKDEYEDLSNDETYEETDNRNDNISVNEEENDDNGY